MSPDSLELAADEIRRLAQREALRQSPPVQRFVVLGTDPVRLEALDRDLRIEEGDEDFDLPTPVKSRAAKGDTVVVVEDRAGHFTAVGVAKPGVDPDSGGGGGVDFDAGPGLTLVGGILAVGEGSGLTVLADMVEVDTTLIAERSWVLAELADYVQDTELTTALALKQDTDEKGQPSGYASLDSSGLVPNAQLSPLALTDVHVVASQAAQLALTAQEGDIAIRSDQNRSYAHNGGTAGTMADWNELLTPTDAVLSVNGATGVVSITLASLGVSTYAQTLLDDADATAARATLGLTLGTQVQAWDDALQALSAAPPGANKLPYFTSAVAAGVTDLSAFIRTLLDDADAATARGTLGVPSTSEAQNPTEFVLPGGSSLAAVTTDREAYYKDGEGLYVYDPTYDTHLFQGSGKAVPVGRAYRGSAASYTSGSTVVFNTEDDPAGIYNPATGELTIAKAGRYDLNAIVKANAAITADKYWIAAIYKNGSQVSQGVPMFQRGTEAVAAAVEDRLLLAAGDVITIRLFHDNGGSVAINPDSRFTYFTWEWVANDYAGGIVTPKAKVYLTANQSVASAGWAKLAFGAEAYDHGGLHDNATNNTRLTAPVAGVYDVSGIVEFAASSAGNRDVTILKNNTTIVAYVTRSPTAGGYPIYVPITTKVALQAGDYLELRAYQDTGGALNVVGDNTEGATQFSMSLIPEPAGVQVPEAFREVGAAGQPPFTNSWSNLDASRTSAAFWKDPLGVVHLKGVIKNAGGAGIGSNTTAFVLPAGYRPTKETWLPTGIANGTVGRVEVSGAGDVRPVIGGTNAAVGNCPLDGMNFRAEQ